MNKYQLLFIIENEAADDVKVGLVDKFSNLIAELGGSVSKVDKWGAKKYAYPINFKTEGYYVLIEFEADGNAPAEIDRQMRINEHIVRQLITRA